MGAPMMPSPMKPILGEAMVMMMGVVGEGGGSLGQAADPVQADLRGDRGLVFAADPAGIAEAVEVAEQEREVDLAGARFVAARVVGDLHVADALDVPAQRLGQLALGSLRVVDVVLQEQ